MAESSGKYLIRDAQGNEYGPADEEMLRAWVAQGRIVPGMMIAERETRQWVDAAVHPAVAHLFSGTPEMVVPGETTEQAPAVIVEPVRPTAEYVKAEVETVAYQDPQSARLNMPGLISMIAGIAAIVSMPLSCVPICGCVLIPVANLMALAAIVLGGVSLYQIKGNPLAYTGKSKAYVGLFMGGSVLLIYVLGLIVIIGIRAMRP